MNRSGKQAEEKKEEVKVNTKEMNETLKKLLSGEDIFETIDTERGQFTIKFPRPRVLRQIQVLLSQRFQGVDLGNMPEKTVRFYEIYATLDIVVVKAPQWWDDLDSSEDCPDDKLVSDLYRRYLRFYNRIQAEIDGAPAGSGEGANAGAAPGKEAPLGGGAFSDIAHGSEDGGAGGRAD